jgi:hypothetical protein
MKKSITFFIFMILCLFVWLTAQNSVSIREIKDQKTLFKNSAVEVIGLVSQWIKCDETSSRSYYLKDESSGELILVMTSSECPEMNKNYKVKGWVLQDEKGDVIINEISRSLYKEGEVNASLNYYLIAAVVFLLMIVIGLIFAMILIRRRESSMDFPFMDDNAIVKAPDLHGHEQSLDTTDTYKVQKSSIETLRLLPGWFEIVRGDDSRKELRFYKNKTRKETEVTFGRGDGPDFSHIQLNPRTVSILHAKLIWTNGKYSLLNYSDTNPTTVNGKPLDKEESVILQEGAEVEMGEMTFIFHEK